MWFTAKFLTVLLAAMSLGLQGCGCNTQSATDCASTFTSSSATITDTAAQCSALDTYVKCIVDSGCCSDSNFKAAMDATVSGLSVVCAGHTFTATC